MVQAVRIGTAEWHPETRSLVRVGQPIRLTRLEQGLLHYLSEHVGTVVPVKKLLRDVWGYAPNVRSRAVDNAVSRLRKKLGNDADHIQTVYGQGFCLLPTQDDALVGREQELVALSELVDASRVVTLYGLGGVGKSALARAFAARWPAHVWLEFHDPTNEDELDCRLAEELGLAPRAIDQVPDQLRAQGRPLVVVDGAEHLGPWLIDRVRQWSDAAPSAAFLLTSRVLFRDETALEIGPLGRDAAVALLRERASASGGGARVRLDELVSLVDCLPLGIELLAARLRVLSAEELVAWLREHGPAIIDSADGRLSRTLDGCWALLDDAARRCLSVAALLGSGFRAEPVGAIAGLAPPATLDALERLLRTGMIRRQGRVYSMLDLVRSFAAERVEPETRARFVRWAAERADELWCLGSAGAFNDREELAELVPTFLRALEEADSPVDRASLLLGIRLHDAHFGPMLRTRTDLEALPLTELPRIVAVRVASERGRVLTEADEREAALACHEYASRLAEDLDDDTERIWAQIRHTNIVRMLKGPAEAVPMARRVLAEVESLDSLSPFLQAEALSSLESCLTTLGKFEEAHRHVLRTIAVLDGNPDRQASSRVRLGFILSMQGERERARAELEKALDHGRKAMLDRIVVAAGRQLGNLLSNAGDTVAARDVYTELAEVAARLGDSGGAFGARLGLASLAIKDDVGRGIQLYEEIRERALHVGRLREASVASLNLGLTAHQRSRFAAAEAAYRECLTIIEPIGWRYVMALAHCFLALLLHTTGRRDEARTEVALADPGAVVGQRIRDAVASALDDDVSRAHDHLSKDVPADTAEAIRKLIALPPAPS